MNDDEFLTEAFGRLRGDRAVAVPVVDAATVRATVATRRRRNRTALVAAGVVVALVLGAGVAMARGGRDRLLPVNPATPAGTASPGPSTARPTPTSPTPSPSASLGRLQTVDWRNATLVRAGATGAGGCTVPEARFRDGRADVQGAALRLVLSGASPRYGDVTGDGGVEALLLFRCDLAGGGSYEGFLAVARQAGQLRVLAEVPVRDATVTAIDVRGRVVSATVAPYEDVTARVTRRYVFRNGTFVTYRDGDEVPSAAPSSAPTSAAPAAPAARFDYRNVTMRVPFVGSPRVPGGGPACPGRTVTFESIEFLGEATVGGCRYWEGPTVNGWNDIDGDGVDDVALEFSIGRADSGATSETAWLYAYSVKTGKPVLLGFVTAMSLKDPTDPARSVVDVRSVQINRGNIVITQRFAGSSGGESVDQTRTFRWTGSGFRPSAAPLDPIADRAP